MDFDFSEPDLTEDYEPTLMDSGIRLLVKQGPGCISTKSPFPLKGAIPLPPSKYPFPCGKPYRPWWKSPCKPIYGPQSSSLYPPRCMIPCGRIYPRPQCVYPCPPIYPYPCRPYGVPPCHPIYVKPQCVAPYGPIYSRPQCLRPFSPQCVYPRPSICVQPKYLYPQSPCYPIYGNPCFPQGPCDVLDFWY